MSPKTTNCILVLNSGSSSIKFKLFSNEPTRPCFVKGEISCLGTAPYLVIQQPQTTSVLAEQSLPEHLTHAEALTLIFNWCETQLSFDITAVAHRVVHGGDRFTASLLLTPEILHDLQQLSSLAPLHQPHNLAAIEMLAQMKPDLIQMACFDTAFHAPHTPLFTEYALPHSLRQQGIRRYGFHGLSYEWICHRLQEMNHPLAQKRIVVAHLGNGASLCAIDEGQSIDTTMGLTALDGLPMGTRCGSLDPGAILMMSRQLHLSIDEIEALLYNESGLKGLSEWTNDVRLLQNSDEPRAIFALDFFCLKVAQFIAMMAVSVGKLDGLIFTGGIGEHSAPVRNKILQHLTLLQPFTMEVIPCDEEQMMVIHAQKILSLL